MQLLCALPNISKMLRQATRQKPVTQWAQQHNPLLKHIQAVCQADSLLRARMNHLAQGEVKGPHPRFDIPSDLLLRFRPTAFLGNILSMINADFSPFQLGQYLKLVLGLDFPAQATTDGNCPCGRANNSTGHHRLNCSRCAGRSWAQGHNLVVSALASENRRLGPSVVDIDAAMRRQCTHVTNGNFTGAGGYSGSFCGPGNNWSCASSSRSWAYTQAGENFISPSASKKLSPA